jgi:3-oxoacyl-(acyl-carrier-protein) synthase
VTIESLIAEAEAARVKAMAEKGGAAAAVSALTAKAKLAGMWRDKVDQHNTGTPAYEHIERIIVERASPEDRLLPPPSKVAIDSEGDFEEQPVTSNSGRHWSE